MVSDTSRALPWYCTSEGGGFFVKLHESCCDARTAADLLRLPGVRELADVPCHAQEGNEWC